MNKKEDIERICKRPHFVKSNGMNLSEISLALGISYGEAKHTLEKALYKLGEILKGSNKEDYESISEYMLHTESYYKRGK